MKILSKQQLKLPLIAVLFISLVILAAGWQKFWFMTDDAYISFRYVSNSIKGFGYVWNPPPFRPVEGYTSFLWVLILDFCWRVFSIEPPRIANWLLLVFSCLNLVVWVGIADSLALARGYINSQKRSLLVLSAILGIVLNRTFLAWSSSGLETALFNFLVSLWIWINIHSFKKGEGYIFSLALVASLIYLTRPDGLVYVGISLVLAVHSAINEKRDSKRSSLSVLSFAPFLIFIAHLLWRKSFYGAWLPNTYYAKYVSAWPESGLKYLTCFIIEYGLWFWLIGLAIWCAALWRKSGFFLPKPTWVSLLKPALVICAITFPFAYYTLIIGGDHFEYRVYSYLIPLIFVSFLMFVLDMASSFRQAFSLMLLFVLISLPVQWVHWFQDANSDAQRFRSTVPINQFFPGPFQILVKVFDENQKWLSSHFVGIRYQKHKFFCIDQVYKFPLRNDTASFEGLGYPVFDTASVGVMGWVFPNFAIIDVLGLNDFVIARNPNRKEVRMMAHERMPPPGYIECFRPNVTFVLNKVSGAYRPVIIARDVQLTANDIVECEKKPWLGQQPL